MIRSINDGFQPVTLSITTSIHAITASVEGPLSSSHTKWDQTASQLQATTISSHMWSRTALKSRQGGFLTPVGDHVLSSKNMLLRAPVPVCSSLTLSSVLLPLPSP